LGWLELKFEAANGSMIRAGSVVALVILQFGSALAYYPYYYTYSNPIMLKATGQIPQSDYGEGFEQAATYLAEKPNSESLKVFAFRARGPFSYFFPGETIILNPLFMEEPGMASVLSRMPQTDYLVINDALGPRTERSAQFVQALKKIDPERSILIKGVSTIRIYRIADLPPDFYETLSR